MLWQKRASLRVNLLVSKRSANAPFRLQSIPITRVQAVPRTSAAAVALAAQCGSGCSMPPRSRNHFRMQAPRSRCDTASSAPNQGLRTRFRISAGCPSRLEIILIFVNRMSVTFYRVLWNLEVGVVCSLGGPALLPPRLLPAGSR